MHSDEAPFNILSESRTHDVLTTTTFAFNSGEMSHAENV